jgi:hypothetical protein
MRGTDQQQRDVSYVSPEQRVRKDHPLRPVRAVVDRVLQELSPEFGKMYSKWGVRRFPRNSCCLQRLRAKTQFRFHQLVANAHIEKILLLVPS